MKLRGIEYGPVWGSSGAQGMFGEGYRPHRIFKILLPGFFTFKGVTFVAKTVTLKRNEGHLPLKEDGITLRETMPKCIVVKLREAAMLNSVGLSNFGAHFYLEKGIWQERTEPFCLSFMAIGKTPEEQIRECIGFVRELKPRLSSFKAPVALQVNESCPNVGHDLNKQFDGASERAVILSELGIPLIHKFNILVPPERVRAFMDDKNCDAVCVSNTIPFGQLPKQIDWKKLFGSETESPLEKYGFGKGGLSGAPIFPVVFDWCDRFGKLDPSKPWIAGGGITRPSDALKLKIRCGPDAISVGSIATVRPHLLGPTVRAIHELEYHSHAQ